MSGFALFLAFTVLIVDILDRQAKPRAHWRQRRHTPIRPLITLLSYGTLCVLTGSAGIATIVVTGLFLILTLSSNAKQKLLGEPLVFSDLVVAKSFLQEPKFYLHAISASARVALVIGIPLLVTTLIYVAWHGSSVVRAAGGILTIICFLLLPRALRGVEGVETPDLSGDMERFGLITTVLIYWYRWRQSPTPPRIRAIPRSHEDAPTLIIIQCESFMDASLEGNAPPLLAGLEEARTRSSLHGRLLVSGFGAYTMRTEYGLLSGRCETALGFRLFDPFLTATSEASYALPERLQALYARRIFVHPHDLKFYARDRLMPALGFNRILGEDHFKNADCIGPYISDQSVGDALIDLVEKAAEPQMIYTVTMENHGPWSDNRLTGVTGTDSYEYHRQHGDILLKRLIDALDRSGKKALLVFFGDHRPSIPGASEPSTDRSTPYVIIPFPEQQGSGAMRDLTPADLHHAIIDAVTQTPDFNRAS